jgi:hypothetical protein
VPYKDPQQKLAHARAIYQARRDAWFEGKHCALCGSGRNLVLDHPDLTKPLGPRVWLMTHAKREAFLAECRPLCLRCSRKLRKRKKATF